MFNINVSATFKVFKIKTKSKTGNKSFVLLCCHETGKIFYVLDFILTTLCNYTMWGYFIVISSESKQNFAIVSQTSQICLLLKYAPKPNTHFWNCFSFCCYLLVCFCIYPNGIITWSYFKILCLFHLFSNAYLKFWN